jgi:fatty-acyl-CoA synthase
MSSRTHPQPSPGPSGLWDTLVGSAGPFHSSLHCWVGDRFEAAGWSEVVRSAESMTAGLRRRGVRPGTRVATVLTNAPHVVHGILGVWLAGGAVASLPVPARGMDTAEYGSQLSGMCEQLQPELFLIEERLLGLLPEQFRDRFGVCSWESVTDSGRVSASPPGDDDVAFIQYSSGSMSTPKGCMLTPRAIAAQIDLTTNMIDARRGRDVTVSWLPLSHDMGMFGTLLTSWANDFDLYLSTPERFAMAPRTWFGDIAQFAATMTAGTNTALYLGARAYGGRGARLPGAVDMTACIVGAERVEWDTLRFVTETFAPYGFRETMLMPAYGLAEATLCVTATPVHEAPRHLVLDGNALADGQLREVAADEESATRVVSAGRPGKNTELPGDAAGRLGEIRIRSASLACGYWADEQRTRAHFQDGTLVTNDLGFVRDGYLYPVGRADDVISVAGRKVYAREIENAVDRLGGVRRGCSTLVGGDGRGLTLFVELGRALDDYGGFARRAASLAMDKAAVALDECVFLRRGSLPKTPSGKIQRHRCRQLHEAGRLQPLATVRLAPR